MGKLNVAVIFGGRSGEHEVSLVSAGAVIEAIDRQKYEPLQIGITTEGKWLYGENALEAFKKNQHGSLQEVRFSSDPKRPGIEAGGETFTIDIAFPVLHGPFGEDGTIQGLFEMLNIPYVGCGVLASATAMDKLQCKAIWEAAGLPVVPYMGITRRALQEMPEKTIKDILQTIGLPCFVKPANMGSSVGITKVKEEGNLEAAIALAAEFDSRIVVEKGLAVREIECAILGNEEALASPVGEVIVGGEFYDFHDKYVNGVSRTQIPAELAEEVSREIRALSRKAYTLLDCSGLARVDCFIDTETEKVYLNEINTMPGFTSISMYPKMMQAHGMEYHALVDRLIELGFERYRERKKNKVVFESGSAWFQK